MAEKRSWLKIRDEYFYRDRKPFSRRANPGTDGTMPLLGDLWPGDKGTGYLFTLKLFSCCNRYAATALARDPGASEVGARLSISRHRGEARQHARSRTKLVIIVIGHISKDRLKGRIDRETRTPFMDIRHAALS